jgi:hypothetical protein
MVDEEKRALLGAERVGEPLMNALALMMDAHDKDEWKRIDRKPLRRYYDGMIATWFPRLLDKALTTEQLAALSEADVGVVALSLFRDLYRHHAHALAPHLESTTWVEMLFDQVAHDGGVTLDDDAKQYGLDDRAWAKRFAVRLGVTDDGRFATKLAMTHVASVEGLLEETNRE